MSWFVVQLKKVFIVVAIAGTGLAFAGSYEDFFKAVQQDDAKKVKELLLRGFDVNTADQNSQTGLYLAVRESSLKSTQVLIDWPKTDVNKLNRQGESPLMLAALNGELELVKKMISKGADVNKTGWTPLHYAASRGKIDIISLLIDHNAYIDAESPNKTTPLMMAAMYASTETVKLLLQEGADPALKNEQGLTALEFAQRSNRPDAVEAIAVVIRRKYGSKNW